MALVPACSDVAPAQAKALAPASAGVGAAQLPAGVHQQEESWPLLTNALMVAVMGSQQPAAAAATLLAVFQPILDGYSVAHAERKLCRKNYEAAIAKHRKHRLEQDSLPCRLRAAEVKHQELESNHFALSTSSAALEKKLAKAKAKAVALSDDVLERKKEVEAQHRRRRIGEPLGLQLASAMSPYCYPQSSERLCCL